MINHSKLTAQPVAGAVCSNDPSHKTKGWRKDPYAKARALCQTCYQTALAQIQTENGRVCSNDPSHKTKGWHKDPYDKTRALCRSCYQTAFAQIQTENGKVCNNDPSHMTKGWRKDPYDKTRTLCRSCYQTAFAQKQTENGKVCSNDSSHKTKDWRKDPKDKTRTLCNACYQSSMRKRKFDEVNLHKTLSGGEPDRTRARIKGQFPQPSNSLIEPFAPHNLASSGADPDELSGSAETVAKHSTSLSLEESPPFQGGVRQNQPPSDTAETRDTGLDDGLFDFIEGPNYGFQDLCEENLTEFDNYYYLFDNVPTYLPPQ
jgi:hypothetical protein